MAKWDDEPTAAEYDSGDTVGLVASERALERAMGSDGFDRDPEDQDGS